MKLAVLCIGTQIFKMSLGEFFGTYGRKKHLRKLLLP